MPVAPLFPPARFPWRSALSRTGPCWHHRRIATSNPPATLPQTVPAIWNTTESPPSSQYRFLRKRRVPPTQPPPKPPLPASTYSSHTTFPPPTYVPPPH